MSSLLTNINLPIVSSYKEVYSFIKHRCDFALQICFKHVTLTLNVIDRNHCYLLLTLGNYTHCVNGIRGIYVNYHVINFVAIHN